MTKRQDQTNKAARTRAWFVYDRDRYIGLIDAPTYANAMDLMREQYGNGAPYSVVRAED